MKEQDKTSEKSLIKTEISGFPDKEFKLKVIKMLSLEECMNKQRISTEIDKNEPNKNERAEEYKNELTNIMEGFNSTD